MATATEQRSGGGGVVKRILFGLLGLVLLLLVVVLGVALYFNIPNNGAGMAAKAVCSAHFVAGRDDPVDKLFDDDVAGASAAFGLFSVSIDEERRSATGSLFGIVKRTAALVPGRGCVLDAEPNPAAEPYRAPAKSDAPWPAGKGVSPGASPGLQQVLDKAMEGAGDIAGANPRGIAVVQGGKLLALREAPGFENDTPLHGWSMTKTVTAMLAYKKLQEVGIDIDTPVVDAFPPDREPSWVAQWRQDDRAKMTIRHLMNMTSGLDTDEGYTPFDAVVQMLNGEPDMAAWAASHGLEQPAGTYWEYLSAVSNVLGAVVRAQFPNDEEYWRYPRTAMFDIIGAETATLETDTSGTWVSSSYLWAGVSDWARFGWLMLSDGKWEGEEVLPPGWFELASQRALPDGEGAGYGAQSWRMGDPIGGKCRDNPGVPADTIGMNGHWGQLVAMVPSRDAVIVRLGWTFKSGQFNNCQLIADVLANLP